MLAKASDSPTQSVEEAAAAVGLAEQTSDSKLASSPVGQERY